jgi:hypothetical protein
MPTIPFDPNIPRDSQGVEIKLDYLVQITDKQRYLDGYRGIVVNLESKIFGGVHPIEVFFGLEVPNNLLMNELGAEKCKGKCGGSQNPKDCVSCPRIVTFPPEVLTVIS